MNRKKKKLIYIPLQSLLFSINDPTHELNTINTINNNNFPAILENIMPIANQKNSKPKKQKKRFSNETKQTLLLVARNQ